MIGLLGSGTRSSFISDGLINGVFISVDGFGLIVNSDF